MIVTKKINDNLICYYSDSDLKIKQIDTEEIYEEAIYPIGTNYNFEETNIEIKREEEDYKQLVEYYKTLLDTISGE